MGKLYNLKWIENYNMTQNIIPRPQILNQIVNHFKDITEPSIFEIIAEEYLFQHIFLIIL